MNLGGAAIASFGGLLTPATGEANLAALASGGSVSMELYEFQLTGSGRSATVTTTDFMKITTNADGTTTVGTSATPIPPAFFLMGSGLLGMFGLRRKQRA